MPDLDRFITAWLDDRAVSHAPDDLLGETLARTSRLERRPAWRIPERWIPMALTLRLAVVPRALITLFLLAFLVCAMVAGGLVVGSLTRAVVSLPPPYGPARNGLIAFDAGGDIWVVEPDGSGRRQLTRGPALDNGPAWSRDGTRIAYWSQDAPGGPSSLIVAAADGSSPRTIDTDDAGRTSLQFLDWSPDGRQIAYSLGATLDPISLDERVFVAATDGSGARQVGDPDLIARIPTWSPDGTTLAFSGSASAGAIEDLHYPDRGVYLMASDGTSVRRLSTMDAEASDEFYRIEWSPDGAKLASQAHGRIWDFAADGSSEVTVTSGEVIDEMIPRWSPDGQSILYVSLDTSHLYTVPPGGGPSTDLGDRGGGHIWSPDGAMVASFTPGPADPGAHLVVLDAGTGDVAFDVEAGDQSYPGIFHYPSWQRLAP